jgi:hypothetical protein
MAREGRTRGFATTRLAGAMVFYPPPVTELARRGDSRHR